MKGNNRKVLSVIVTIALIFSMFAGFTITASAATAYTMTDVHNGATLSSGDMVSIGDATEMGYFATYVNTSGNTTSGIMFYLTGNITLSGSWTPVGIATIGTNGSTSSPYVSAGAGFAGTFDGNGKTISGLSVSTASAGTGLFKYLAPTGVIQNLTVSGTVSSTGSDAVGGVVGYNSGIVNNVINNVTVSAVSTYNVGGIAGFNNSYYGTSPMGIIVNSKNTASVTGNSKVGGIVGENAGTISSSSNSGTIIGSNTGSKNGVGGIAGRNGNNNTAAEIGKIIDCYNAGTVGSSGQKWVGGITGFQNSLSSVYNCYDTGTIVAGSGYYNPIVGSNEGTTTYAYSLSGLNAKSTLEAEKGIVKTQAEMQASAFVDLLNSHASRTLSPYIWATGGSGAYPILNYNAAVPSPSGGGSSNNYSVIYLSNSGSDSNTGSTTSDPVATLGKAVQIADKSTVSTVYISVMDPITVSTSQTAYGGNIPVQWTNTSTTGAMFTVSSGVKLDIGGLSINGNNNTSNIDTVFSVAGTLTVQNNASITNCGTAINVASGGSLSLNRSSISGTNYSVYLNGGTPPAAFTMYAGSGQSITLNGTVYLGSGTHIALGSVPTSTVTVTCQDNVSDDDILVAVADSTTTATSAASEFQYSTSGVGFYSSGVNIYAYEK